MSDSVDGNQQQGVEFRFRDDLPLLCVVCGAPATGTRATPVEMPRDAQSNALSLLQIVSVFFGFFFFWFRTSPAGGTENEWVSLPHCNLHGSGEEINRNIHIFAVGSYRAMICGAAPAFCEALKASSGPPPDEFLGALDVGPGGNTEAFLEGIDKSQVKTSKEFLSDLERNSQDD